KAAVLRTALPEGARILTATAKSVESFATTIQEADATRLRVDELRRALAETEREAAVAMPSDAIPSASLHVLLRQAQLGRTKWYKAEADVRESSAWEFTLRAGYDHFLLVPEGRPLFATGTLTFNLAAPWQRRLEKRVLQAQEQWFLQRPDGIAVHTMKMIRRLQSIQNAEAARLKEIQLLMDDLELRIHSMREIGGLKAQSYADYLWFDYVKLKAEEAFLRTHLTDLAALTGDDSPAPSLPTTVAGEY